MTETVQLVLIITMKTLIKQVASKTLALKISFYNKMENVALVRLFPAKIYQILQDVLMTLTYAILPKNLTF